MRVSGTSQWTHAELLMEYRTDEPGDPFAQEPRPLRRRYDLEGLEGEDNVEPEDVLERILSDATWVFNSQQRTHLFTVLFFATKARFICWDRAGYVVSEPFDYVSDPSKLILLLWRFARMSRQQRGHDTTASRIFPGCADHELMMERAKPPTVNVEDAPTQVHEHARAAFADSLANAVCWRLKVDDAKKGPQYFLVGEPRFQSPGLTGRGTRNYVAIDAADPYGPFVYLKDIWRIVGISLQQEGDVLETLNGPEDGGPVPFVPTVRCHGHVRHQEAQHQKLFQDTRTTHQLGSLGSKSAPPLKTRRHYRLIVNEVSLPLSSFQRGSELVGLFMCVIKAHGEAFTRKGFIHQDISAENVLIFPTLRRSPRSGEMQVVRTGLLANWELARHVDEVDEVDQRIPQPIRVGTWQFMSANALNHLPKMFIVQDHMESIFHLLLYQAIRYLPSNCYDVRDFVSEYFDAYKQQDGVYYGGRLKIFAMRRGLLTNPRSEPLLFYRSKPGPPTEISKTSKTSSVLEDVSPTTHTAISASMRMEHETDSTIPRTSQSPMEEKHAPHPINDLLDDILCSLKAHYALYHSEDRPTRTATVNVELPGLEQDTNTNNIMFLMQDFVEHIDKAGGLRPTRAVRSSSTGSLSPAERAEMEADAALLASHNAMIDLFVGYYQEMQSWPQNDRVPDALRK
ncbi:hypothetical protein C8Q70DRAFT_210444 [Cubamyces menziesii]|nr:hypothetical protein C8Q70DRAFT_210444 [Cubamyces menziesii]